MLHKEEKNQLINQFKINEHDNGSVEVQVALLTKQIEALSKHFETNKKDFGSKRGLLKMVSKRKKFLEYLRRKNPEGYQAMIKSLGLRK